MSDSNTQPTLTRKDFQTDQEVRWCPGCGDYAILAAVQRVLPTLGIPRENVVFVSGIGCSSRFPYYVETYGFHGIHGRAPAIATGIKLANPELSVWVATGDGDALSIGGNHLIHALRRNVDLKIILFNNRIYGLTKGQHSPTSEKGKRTKSTPYGSVDHPFRPLSVALGAEATFVARSIDVDAKHLGSVLERAAAHKGSAFVEVYQNCNVFNDGAFAYFTDRSERDDRRLVLEHGEPLRFGPKGSKGIRLRGDGSLTPEVVHVGAQGSRPEDLLVFDEAEATGTLAHLLASFEPPEFPLPVGVFRDVKRDVFDVESRNQIERTIEAAGEGQLESLFESGETWTIG